MKIVINKIIILITSCLFIISCNDYLDVKQEDKLLEKDLFSTKKGFEIALNGIYTSMASQELYGGNLTMSFVEVLAQRFDVGHVSLSRLKESEYSSLGEYDFNDNFVVEKITQIWNQMYATILNINNFLRMLKKNPTILLKKHQKILEGEAYGLRAMLHFDLLRLFGPVYNEDSGNESIPYRDQVTPNDIKSSLAFQIIEKILADLNTAENLLKEDPIRKYGKIASLEENVGNLKANDSIRNYEDSDFYRFRNLRMNYYAVKALQARVNLYAGNKLEALAAAKVVINEGKKWFPWTNSTDVIASKTPDRLFSKELIFSLPNPNIRDSYKAFYSDDLGLEKILTSNPTRLKEVYANENDYRFKADWAISSKHSSKIFIKFRQEDILPESKEQQPLIRLSELYYIAAETDPNLTEALKYLNTVRYNRGLVKINNISILTDEIAEEYKREFYGEGQLFFYYKRVYYRRIPNGSKSTFNSFKNMEFYQYVIPIPKS